MTDAHVWDDVIDATTRSIYSGYLGYERERGIKGKPALLAIDLYEAVFAGGNKPVPELVATYPSACGVHAWRAIEPITRLFVTARAAGLPIAYSTGDTRPNDGAAVRATKRGGARHSARDYEIRPEFAPEPADIVVRKQRASAFFGTPLVAHLVQRGVDTVVICGETTSGCVRASAVDAYSYGFHVVIVEECTFDRSLISHKVNLFDLHQKYADVLHLDDVERQLRPLATAG